MAGPIFLFAASYRTGSTLLQRVFTATGNVLVWGEPNKALPALVNLTREARAQFQHPRSRRVHELATEGGIHKAWIALLLPEPDRALEGARAWLDAVYGGPASQLGYPRWGLKDCRVGAMNAAEVLHEVYPDARFVFLIRDPHDALASVKSSAFFPAFERGSKTYLNNWLSNAAAFADEERRARLPCTLVRYEDLAAEERRSVPTLEALLKYLDLPFTDAVFEALEARRRGGQPAPADLDRADLELVASMTGRVCERLEYPLRV